ncbi:MAG: rhodanese-like domain-containing protein [Bacteroidales bacterium]
MRLMLVHDLKDMMDKGTQHLVIDTRDQDDFDFAHIAGSVNIPRPEFEDHIHEIPRDIPVILVCKYGKKSEQLVTMLMEDHGYKNCKSLLGGLWEYSREIDPSLIVW